MTSRFVLPLADVGAGLTPSAGAQLFFYETGTTTPKDTYSDAAGTIPNANPVIANAVGVFDDIFISGTYKVVLKNAAGVQQWAADPVESFLRDSQLNDKYVLDRANLAAATVDTTIKAGDAVNLAERTAGNGGGGMWDVIAGTGTADGVDIIAHDTLNLSFVKRELTEVNDKDYATFGANMLPALSSFTKTNFDASGNHTAGTVGTMTAPLEVDPFSYYMLKVVVNTTTSGRVKFEFGSASLVSDVPQGYYFSNKSIYTNGFENNRIMDSTTYWFMFSTSTVGYSGFTVETDTSWAGQISSAELTLVSGRDMSYISYGTGTAARNNPIGIKAGSYNRNDVALGDKFTLGAFVGTDGASPQAGHNTFTGAYAGSSLLYGDQNSGHGPYTLQYCEGSNNTAAGYSALKLTTKGQENTATGYKSAVSNTVGSKNCVYGFRAGVSYNDASEYSAFGWQAGANALTGDQNCYFGGRTGLMNLDGIGNTYIGTLAGFASGVGLYSYDYTTTVGYQSTVYGNNGVAVGRGARVGSSSAAVDNGLSIGDSVINLLANSGKVGNGHTATALSGKVLSKQVYAGVTSGTGTTFSASEFFSEVIERSSPSANFSDTTPTAADLIALMPAPEVATGYDLYIRNLTGFTQTILAGTGVALTGTTTIGANKTRLFKVRVNSVSSSTVGIYGIAEYDN